MTHPLSTTRYLPLLLPLLLSGCGLLNTPPSVTITAPSPDAAVSATTPVTVSVEDDGEVARVDLYARAPGDTGPGLKVGGSSSAGGGTTGTGGTDASSGKTQFTVSWNTSSLPNLSALEIYAVATDDGGLTGKSAAVPVTLSSSGAPNLRYFASITLPGAPGVAGASLNVGGSGSGVSSEWEAVNNTAPGVVGSLEGVGVLGLGSGTSLPLDQGDLRPLDAEAKPQPPALLTTHRSPFTPSPSSLTSQATSTRNQVLEWAWDAQSGARGYVTSLSKAPLSGYLKQDSLKPENATGLQKYSKLFPAATLSETFYGTVSALTTTGEGPRSNTFGTHLLEVQPEGAASNLTKGRPTLSWTAHPDPDVIGYYYFVYKKDPLLNPQEVPLWTNSGGRTTAKLTATYPLERDALPKGKYFFWIAGVSFNPEGGASGFSFSELRGFEIK